MLKTTLAAGFFLTALNILPSATPTARAASPIAVPAAAVRTEAPATESAPAKTMIVASVAAPATATAAPAVDVATAHGFALTAAESEFVALVNKERTSRGENALTVDPLLTTTARAHSHEMCQLNYFAHYSPTAGLATPMDRYMKGLHDTCAPVPESLLVGENIYYCSTFDSYYNVAYGHDSLMHSPGHRANILDPRFTKIGVGTYQDASGQFWVTQMFMSDKS